MRGLIAKGAIVSGPRGKTGWQFCKDDMEFAKLADGNQLPMLGLGVWQVPDGRACVDAVRMALELGYRHIDTAQAYGNEASVGKALRDSGVPRDEVFITTKFYPGRKDPVAEAEQSLRKLGVDQVDLYLVHWPQRGPVWAWPGMERARERGLARSIGVSNFGADDLEQVIAAGSVTPAVNQINFSAVEYRRGLLDACRAHGTSYSRPTVRSAPAATWATRGWPRSRNGSAAPRHRCCCAGACSTASRSFPSRRTASGSRRTPRSSTSPCPMRTWPPSTRSTRRTAPTVPWKAPGGSRSFGPGSRL